MSEKEQFQDEILNAFNDAKEEQLSLLDYEKEEAPQVAEHQTVPSEPIQEKMQPEPVVKETENLEEEVFYVGTDGTQYTEEEWNAPVIRNGPTRREVEGWKEKYKYIYFTPFDDEVFVWRTLQRPEYREIIRDTTLTALDREEMFTEKCVLYPYDFSLEKIKKSRAGIASLLAEMIMDKSGFVAQSAPIKL